MATRKKNAIDHDTRKSSSGYAKYKADNKARNALRPKQELVVVMDEQGAPKYFQVRH